MPVLSSSRNELVSGTRRVEGNDIYARRFLDLAVCYEDFGIFSVTYLFFYFLPQRLKAFLPILTSFIEHDIHTVLPVQTPHLIWFQLLYDSSN